MTSRDDIADGAPDIRVLWSKTHTATRTHLCDICNAFITKGERYKSAGFIEDGEFKAEKHHIGAGEYPSGCPRFRASDVAELEASAAEGRGP